MGPRFLWLHKIKIDNSYLCIIPTKAQAKNSKPRNVDSQVAQKRSAGSNSAGTPRKQTRPIAELVNKSADCDAGQKPY